MVPQIISFHCAYLHKERCGASADLQLLPPSIVYLLGHCSSSAEASIIVAPLDLGSRQYVLLPLNDSVDVSRAYGGAHWSVRQPCVLVLLSQPSAYFVAL